MTRRLMWMVALAALAAPAARAQDHKVELSGTAGWVFSDGVSSAGADFIRLDPKDANVLLALNAGGPYLGVIATREVKVQMISTARVCTSSCGSRSRPTILPMSSPLPISASALSAA